MNRKFQNRNSGFIMSDRSFRIRPDRQGMGDLWYSKRPKDCAQLHAAVPLLIAFLVLAFMLAAIVTGVWAQVVGAQFNNARLERLRGLAFRKPVSIVAIKPSDAQPILVRDLGRDYSDERLRADGIAGSMVGVFPAHFDLKAEILKQALTQHGAVYFDHLKEIVLIPRGTDSYATIDMSWLAAYSSFFGNTLAHELTHALQDQHFDLERWHHQLRDEQDQSAAFDSVVEGDATLAAVAYTGDYIDASVVKRVVSNLDGWRRRMNTWASDQQVPEALAAQDIFTHMEGIKFVAEAYRRGGWPAVDALYIHPPVSTQQIMNPQLYFDHKAPVKIQLAGYEKVLPAAAVIHTDTFGELLLQVILQRNLGEYRSQSSLAQRWAGDRMAILRQGDAITIIWMIAFSDPSSAQQFAAYYASILDRLHGAATPHLVNYRNNAVLCVADDGLRQHPELPTEVWKQTSIAPGA
jgi:hypothetical protein